MMQRAVLCKWEVQSRMLLQTPAAPSPPAAAELKSFDVDNK